MPPVVMRHVSCFPETSPACRFKHQLQRCPKRHSWGGFDETRMSVMQSAAPIMLRIRVSSESIQRRGGKAAERILLLVCFVVLLVPVNGHLSGCLSQGLDTICNAICKIWEKALDCLTFLLLKLRGIWERVISFFSTEPKEDKMPSYHPVEPDTDPFFSTESKEDKMSSYDPVEPDTDPFFSTGPKEDKMPSYDPVELDTGPAFGRSSWRTEERDFEDFWTDPIQESDAPEMNCNWILILLCIFLYRYLL